MGGVGRRAGAAAERAVEGLNRLMAGICHAMLVTIVAVIVAQVFLRYAMRSPTGWSEELALLLLIWYGMIAIGIAVWRHGHIAITTLRDRLGPRGGVALDYLAHLLILAFALVIFWRSFDLIGLAGRQVMPSLGISRRWLYYPATVGAALMALNAAAAILLARVTAREPAAGT